MYLSVPQICPPPPFCNLSLSTKHRGAYARDVTSSLAITPSLPIPVKHDLTVGGVWGPSVRRRDAPDATGRLTSFSVEGRGSRVLPRSSWRVHR